MVYWSDNTPISDYKFPDSNQPVRSIRKKDGICPRETQWRAIVSDARWNSVLTASLEVKFRQIWVFTAKFLKIKVFKHKSGKSVNKMQLLQKICFDLNNLNGLKESS